ncbi:hypothetical protein NHX12_020671 [Muraenolepis orangiensis]|uniref:Ras-associating domain-containing protein n=1 Tax=Muraenolepis orangiensis TaxID=630683 RepID=A0A9Q0EVB4_9TELE|nr:hypothetical protein NHX12_020671 [Muraenolepis orangiensis]
MTWSSTMSSGYSSLEEDSEEYFFTARTSFFNTPSGKPSESQNVEKDRERRTQLSREEIRQKVEQYNALTKDHLKMTLVQLELRRPVTVRGGRGPVSGEEAFYLPLGSTNTLHISSNNTVKQVIVALLNKFTVADNPAKYALYKRYSREEQGSDPTEQGFTMESPTSHQSAHCIAVTWQPPPGELGYRAGTCPGTKSGGCERKGDNKRARLTRTRCSPGIQPPCAKLPQCPGAS